MKPAFALALATTAALLAAACSDPIDPGGEPSDEITVLDPLEDIPQEVDANSLDDLYRKVLLPSCAGQQGLCHSGQFEPNLSTPALAYYNLVEKPGVEKRDRMRVVPGDPAASLLIDKLRNRDVISVMPLGAQHLGEDQIQAIEAWIAAGAKRFPDADKPAAIDQPPEEPQLAIFDPMGTRLDLGGSAVASPGQTVVLRMTTHDFETSDEEIPYAVFLLQTGAGDLVVFNPGTDDPTSAYAELDQGEAPPIGDESFNWKFEWTVPAAVDMMDAEGNIMPAVPTAGQSFFLIGAYIPTIVGNDYLIAINFIQDGLRIEP
jgi:hypothetical protein